MYTSKYSVKQAAERFYIPEYMDEENPSKNFLRFTSSMYGSQRRRSITRGHGKMVYSLDNLRDWLLSQPSWDSLYLNWRRSGYSKELAPSVDRSDNSQPYIFSNMELMTWEKNNKKGWLDNSLRVGQYTLEGHLIKEWPSKAVASRALGISQVSIGDNCNGRSKSVKGFKWIYLLNAVKNEQN